MDSKTVPELKKIAKQRGYTGYSRLRKHELIAMLQGKKASKRSPSKRSPKTSRKKNKKCKSVEILNPSSNRCVKKTGRIGQKLLASVKKFPKSKVKIPLKECPKEKILNPATGKCVLKTGRIGKNILAESSPSVVPVVEADVWYMYTIPGCIYCERSEQIFKTYGKKYKVIPLSAEKGDEFLKRLQKYLHNSNISTFPIIYHNTNFIGNYHNLEAFFGTQPISTKPSGGPLSYILPKGATMHKTTTFRGSVLNEMAGFLYLMYKHKDDCAVMGTEISIHKTYSFDHWQIEYINEEDILRIPPDFWNNVKKCKGKRFYIMPMGILINAINKSHSNMLIYDSKTKSLERFEPHGSIKISKYNGIKLDTKILNTFRKNMGYSFVRKYYTPIDFCPSISFQTLESYNKEKKKGDPGGFCAAWSYWYANLRLSNPDIDRKEIIDRAISTIKTSPDTFREFIRSYSATIAKYAVELQSSGDPVKTFVQYAKLYSD